MGVSSTMSSDARCPKCGATQGQVRLSAAALGRLEPDVQREAAAHFDTAHQCGKCGAPYSFRSGMSFAFIKAAPRQPLWPLSQDPRKLTQD
jgi:ribosomal protein S27AE